MTAKLDRVVFIDTTEVMSKGKSALFAADLRRMAEASIVVTSTLVLDELAANYRQQRDKITAGHARFFPVDRLPTPEALRQEFERHLVAVGVTVLSVSATLQEVVAADLQGGSPFKKEGAGYRDFINWATFVDHVKTTSAAAGSFLTSNHKDFSEAGCRHQVAGRLVAVARERGCHAELETMPADDYIERRFPGRPPTAEGVHLERALSGWLAIVEDSELLNAMRLPGPGHGVELKVLGIRDTSAELQRGPENGAVRMIFRATFDCMAVLDADIVRSLGLQTLAVRQHQPWVTERQAVRLEWRVEAPFDEEQGITDVPMQIAPPRRIDPSTGQSFDWN